MRIDQVATFRRVDPRPPASARFDHPAHSIPDVAQRRASSHLGFSTKSMSVDVVARVEVVVSNCGGYPGEAGNVGRAVTAALANFEVDADRSTFSPRHRIRRSGSGKSAAACQCRRDSSHPVPSDVQPALAPAELRRRLPGRRGNGTHPGRERATGCFFSKKKKYSSAYCSGRSR